VPRFEAVACRRHQAGTTGGNHWEAEMSIFQHRLVRVAAAAVAVIGWGGVLVPRPAALPLFLSALAGLGLLGWRRRQAAA